VLLDVLPIRPCLAVSRSARALQEVWLPGAASLHGRTACYRWRKSGELNTFTHVWVYESAADREAKRAKMAADPDWKVYIAENVKPATSLSRRTA